MEEEVLDLDLQNSLQRTELELVEDSNSGHTLARLTHDVEAARDAIIAAWNESCKMTGYMSIPTGTSLSVASYYMTASREIDIPDGNNGFTHITRPSRLFGADDPDHPENHKGTPYSPLEMFQKTNTT